MTLQTEEQPTRSTRGRAVRPAWIFGAVAAGASAYRARGGTRRSVRSVAVVLAATFLVTLISGSALAQAETSGPPTPEAGATASEIGATHASFSGSVYTNGSETHCRVEYATEEGGPWAIAQSDTGPAYQPNSPAYCGDASVGNRTHHLTPKTVYFVRVTAENAFGKLAEVPAVTTTKFTTLAVGPPQVFTDDRNKAQLVGTTFIDPAAEVDSNGAETEYKFEYAMTPAGPWIPIPGASGVITVAEDFAEPEAHLTGLDPGTTYYERVTATNAKGAVNGFVNNWDFGQDQQIPYVGIHNLSCPSVGSRRQRCFQNQCGLAHIEGEFRPGEGETHWRLEYAPGTGGPWTVASSGTIPASEASAEFHDVEGELAGLKAATTYYYRLFAENEHGDDTSAVASFETAGPPTASTFAVHTFDGEAPRLLGSVRPHGLDTHYHFEYVTQEQFESSGFVEASSTPERDAGPGGYSNGYFPTTVVGEDLPGCWRVRLTITVCLR